MAFVDFTNPAACKWYQDKLANLVDLGVEVFKVRIGSFYFANIDHAANRDSHNRLILANAFPPVT